MNTETVGKASGRDQQRQRARRRQLDKPAGYRWSWRAGLRRAQRGTTTSVGGPLPP